jgi:hypothetical protein
MEHCVVERSHHRHRFVDSLHLHMRLPSQAQVQVDALPGKAVRAGAPAFVTKEVFAASPIDGYGRRC